MHNELETRLFSIENKLDRILSALSKHPKGVPIEPCTDTTNSKQPSNELLGLEETAKKLGISSGHLRNLQSTEKVPYYRIGNSVRFAVAELRVHFLRRPRRQISKKNANAEIGSVPT